MHLLLKTALMASILFPVSLSAYAQSTVDPVQWNVATASEGSIHRGAATNLHLEAQIKDGWHIYGIDQVPGGPTPLKASVQDNTTAQATGKITSSPPIKAHDTSFDLDTQVYAKNLSLTIPVRVSRDAPVGAATVPVSVRYQSCSDRTCLPPKTVHLIVPIGNVTAS